MRPDMAPMRILHLDEQRGWRGGEQQASYLIRGQAARGHAVFIAGRPGSEFLARDHGNIARAVACPFAGEADLYTAACLARLVRRERIDIIHAHTSHTHTIACLTRMLARRGRAIVSRRVDFNPSSNAWSRAKYTWPDRFIAISRTIAEVLHASGVPRERVSVVHSAIDAARLEAEPLSRADLGLPDDAFVIGNVAALVDHKDQATLVRAMAEVLRENPKAHAVIAGEGPLRANLLALTEQLGISSHVHLLGYRNDVPRLLHSLDVFVMSSKEEGLGTSVLDAMACRLPVVATAGGGIPEMVRHDVTGLLVPVGDAHALAQGILAIAADPATAARLAKAGQTMVREEFHVDRMVEGNLAVYREVLGAR